MNSDAIQFLRIVNSLQGFCSGEMCRALDTRLRLELNLGVIERPGRRQNTSGGYRSSGKTKNWMALE